MLFPRVATGTSREGLMPLKTRRTSNHSLPRGMMVAARKLSENRKIRSLTTARVSIA
jgi:hypothetical protein